MLNVGPDRNTAVPIVAITVPPDDMTPGGVPPGNVVTGGVPPGDVPPGGVAGLMTVTR